MPQLHGTKKEKKTSCDNKNRPCCDSVAAKNRPCCNAAAKQTMPQCCNNQKNHTMMPWKNKP